MIRLLWIPTAGTVAALIAIVLAHSPREDESPAVPEDPSLPELPFPGGELLRDLDLENKKPPPPPPPDAMEFPLQLESDGSFVRVDSGETFADAAAVAKALAADERVRNRVILSNGDKVAEDALDKALAALSAKFDVRKVYSAPKK